MGRDIQAADPLKFRCHRFGAPACRPIVTKIKFKGASCGFKPGIRLTVIKSAAIRSDMPDDDMVVAINVATAPRFLGMFPNDVGVVLGPHGCEDPRHGFCALLVGKLGGWRQGNVMESDCRPAAIAKGLHVSKGLGLGRNGRADMHDMGNLSVLF